MVGRAKSQYRRTLDDAELREELICEAVKRYRNQGSHTVDGTRPKRKSMVTIAREVAQENPIAARRGLIPSQSTISRRIRGGRSPAEAKEETAHLKKPGSRVVVEYADELSKRGIPLSHRRLEEHINEVLCQENPDFPGVGKNFTQRFVDRNRKQLSTCWSRTLEGKRAGAANSTTNKAWFKLLGETIRRHKIPASCIFGMDETGIQPGEGQSERVITTRGNSSQPQTRSGGRENTTVMVTICADGTTIPPTVIFKGAHYLVRWNDDNPLKASIGHSQKGWITGEIALCWIQEFDKRTAEKAVGQKRLLLLDGHASHLTRAFLEYGREAGIIILCYPSHSTHIYQGLDVVCFGPFKYYWSKQRDQYEQDTGLVVQKSNFMRVISEAYVHAFTPQNIQTAFRKTGVVPFNPAAISVKLLSPAVETSTRESLPIRQPSPIQAIVHSALYPGSLATESCNTPIDEDAVEELRKTLASTSFGFLLHSTPVPLDHDGPPTFTYPHISPLSANAQSLLAYTPETEQESRLVRALHEFAERDALYATAIQSASAVAVLQGMYCSRLKAQLFSSQKTKDNDSARLLSDGLPAVLTSDDFLARVVNRDKARENEAQLKEARKKATTEQKEAIARWKMEEKERVERNNADAQRYKQELKQWKAQRDRARRQGTELKVSEPIMPKRRPPVPRPKKRQVEPELELELLDTDGYESESNMSGSNSDSD